MQQPYYRTTRNGNTVPVVPCCPPINCAFSKDDGEICNLHLTKASDIRDHFVKDHAKGLVTKPYKCERCWKRYATPKQRNSHKEHCKNDRPEESSDMKIINELLDQVEDSTQTSLLITTEGVQKAMDVINDANQKLGTLVPPCCAWRRQQGSNPGTATGFSSPQSSPTPQPSASPPHHVPLQMLPETPALSPHRVPQQVIQEAPTLPPHHVPQQMVQEAPAAPASPGHGHHHHRLLPAQVGYYNPTANPAPNNSYDHVYQPAHSGSSLWNNPMFPPVCASDILPIDPSNAVLSEDGRS